ncbi:RAMP superfamily CRISPR-associated protein [Sphaerothrix gracilis]|uniref:RAMP superfamily CRISPR-associated protein n=1 Tax=Sphaerothrix gracilis TaxID=3151835 RepID=UPI0031FBD71A
MHKRLVNHCTIDLTLMPQGPVLVKSGKEGANPTKPDMEFVETYHAGGRSIFFPGSSLKGALRAHAERIVRTIGSDQRPLNLLDLDPQADPLMPLWATDPLDRKSYTYLEKQTDTQKIYRWSSFTDQLFGSVAIASRLRIEDAYPDPKKPKPRLEERNGVAIDRVFGSVAVGPFNYQVCTEGEFRTKIHLKNFTLEQLGLLGLVLRDLDDGWFGLGFAKSRGMGLVAVKFNEARVEYPGCVIREEQIVTLGSNTQWPSIALKGAGAFLTNNERQSYGFPPDDVYFLREYGPNGIPRLEEMQYGLGVQLQWPEGNVEELFEAAVSAWSRRLVEVTQ